MLVGTSAGPSEAGRCNGATALLMGHSQVKALASHDG